MRRRWPRSVDIPVKAVPVQPHELRLAIATLEADSWEHPEEWSKAGTEVGPIGGCERVPFDPSIESTDDDSAESSSGLNISLNVPQAG